MVNFCVRAVLWTMPLSALGLSALVHAAQPQASPGQEIELLKLIDPDRDAVVGQWKRSDDALYSPPLKNALLQIPYLPPREYDLTLEVELKGPPESINLGLVGEGHQLMVVVNGWGGTTGGVHLVGGREGNSNETTFKEGLIRPGIPTSVAVSVRRDRLTVRVAEKTVLAWSTDYRTVSIENRWASRDPRTLFVGSYATTYKINRIVLTPFTGEGKKLTVEPALSRRIGVTEGAPFEDLAPVQGHLVGAFVTTEPYEQNAVIKSIQPIFRVGNEARKGAIHGRQEGGGVTLLAPDGYAVSGIIARAGGGPRHEGWDRIYGLRLTFMKIRGDALDPSDQKSSEWIGCQAGLSEFELTGGGRKVIGLYGRHGGNLDALGLIYQDPGARAEGIGKGKDPDPFLAEGSPRTFPLENRKTAGPAPVATYVGAGYWVGDILGREIVAVRVFAREIVEGIPGTILRQQESGIFLFVPDQDAGVGEKTAIRVKRAIQEPWMTSLEGDAGTPRPAPKPFVLPRVTAPTLEEASKIMEEAVRLTEEQATELESALSADPKNLACRLFLLGYHSRRGGRGVMSRGRYFELVVGLIEHHPTLDLAFELSRFLNPPAFQTGREAWLAAVQSHSEDAHVLGHAGAYLALNLFVVEGWTKGREFLETARKLDPRNPEWPQRLGEACMVELVGAPSKELAARGMGYLEEAAELTPLAKKGALRPEGRHLYHALSQLAFEAGNMEKARTYASKLRNAVNEKDESWNYGNALHDASTILGRVSLKEGRREDAKRYLLESGRTPGSPQLHSFGPSMELASELLGLGESETVIQYLELCRVFWKSPDGLNRLDEWTQAIKDGKAPEFKLRGRK